MAQLFVLFVNFDKTVGSGQALSSSGPNRESVIE